MSGNIQLVKMFVDDDIRKAATSEGIAPARNAPKYSPGEKP